MVKYPWGVREAVFISASCSPRMVEEGDGGKGMAAVETVPCVRLGSIVFGEKSYEMDANAELSEGPIVTKGR